MINHSWQESKFPLTKPDDTKQIVGGRIILRYRIEINPLLLFDYVVVFISCLILCWKHNAEILG